MKTTKRCWEKLNKTYINTLTEVYHVHETEDIVLQLVYRFNTIKIPESIFVEIDNLIL